MLAVGTMPSLGRRWNGFQPPRIHFSHVDIDQHAGVSEE